MGGGGRGWGLSSVGRVTGSIGDAFWWAGSGTSVKPSGVELSEDSRGRDRDTAVEQSQSEVEEQVDTGKKSKQRPFWKELPILLAVALLLALLIKTFLVQAFFIPSGSMQNTLGIGDRILVNKVVYHVHGVRRGDIVVFKGEESWAKEAGTPTHRNPVSQVLHNVIGVFGFSPSGTDYIKRVIGLPGDHVQCAGHGAPVTVNGKPLQEKSYLYPGNDPCDEPFSTTVPAGRLWVMGDHRNESADSRFHTEDPGGGAIKETSVIGKAFVTVWPIGSWRTL